MRLGVFLAFTAFCPFPVLAQEWATRSYCEVSPRPVQASDFAPYDLAELDVAAAAIPNANGRFWRIQSPGGTISHLWGTYHVSAPAILDLPNIVRNRIETSRALALETDYTFRDRDSFLERFNEPGRYRDPGDPFSMQDPLNLDFLDAPVQSWIFDRLDGYGAPEDELFILTYQGLAAMLLADPCEDFFAGTIPVQDDYILTLGHIAGANIIGLEQPEEFFADLSKDEDTAKAIVAVYASYLAPQDTADARAASFQLYLEGRLGLLSAWDDAFVTGTLGDDGETALDLTNRYLVDFRNRRFLERLAKPLEEGGVFIAIGAAHLPGANGMVSLLQENGFKLTRVQLPGEAE